MLCDDSAFFLFLHQVCGKLCSLKSHIAVMKLNSLFDGTDFKLASCRQPLNDIVARECGFTSLSVRVVQVKDDPSFQL